MLSRSGAELLSRISWTVLLVSVAVLMGCDTRKSVLSVSPREPANRVAAGESLLPVASGLEQTMAPRELFEAFKRIQQPGVDTHLIELDGKPSMLVFEIDLALFEPLLVGVGRSTPEGVSANDAITRFDLSLIVGSGFVAELNSLSPVGLLQIDGSVISELQRYGYTRILGVRSEGIGVVASREYHTGMFESALQVGPGIVEEGLLDISVRDLQRPEYFRTFVATCGTRTLIGASQVPMHLHTLGKRLLEYLAEVGLSCDEVVNLAGDREVLLAMAAHDNSRLVYFGHLNTAKASLLGFRRRREP
ncbi:MAG: hypothetical protein O7F71_07645 [Gammaproteobacteria bacterium]|nr:hypothetical protein [Gammaproteobacteria bacterium]